MAEKQPKRKRSEEQKVKKKGYDHERAKTRVNIGVAFRRWRERKLKDLKTDADVAIFLLDSSYSLKVELVGPTAEYEEVWHRLLHNLLRHAHKSTTLPVRFLVQTCL